MKLLIAYDGSECADSALKELVHAGLPDRGEALIMMVAEVWLPPPAPSASEVLAQSTVAGSPLDLERRYMRPSKVVKEAERMAQAAAARFQTDFPNWKVESTAVWGSPGWELFTKAEEWKADLIAVGSHGRSAFSRAFLGSISQWLLNNARCSVRVARGHQDERDFPVRVIIAIDGSRRADAAVLEVTSRNWPAKSEFRVMMVNQPLEPTVIGEFMPLIRSSVDESAADETKQAGRLTARAVKILMAKGLRASASVASGDPKRILIETAEEWRADCIFLGATGVTNRLERFLLGSVAGAVAARAHCSVEIVRRRRRARKTNGNGK